MRVLKLSLQNFRNFSDLHLDFSNEGAFFYGRNGRGKTNIVEALYMLAFFKSFRSNLNEHVIKQGCSNASVHAVYTDASGLENEITLNIKKKAKNAW